MSDDQAGAGRAGREALLALAAELEAAGGPDGGLSIRVLRAFGWKFEVIPAALVDLVTEPGGEEETVTASHRLHVTGDLEACRRLHAKVLPGWTRAVDATAPEAGVDVDLYPPDDSPLTGVVTGKAATEELAWLAALLKAKAAEDEAGGRREGDGRRDVSGEELDPFDPRSYPPLSARRIPHHIWWDEDHVVISWTARLLDIGLRAAADDCGIFEWAPERLRIFVRPCETERVRSALAEIEAAGLARRFARDGADYGALRGFCVEQPMTWRRQRYPLPDELKEYVQFKGYVISWDRPPDTNLSASVRAMILDRDGARCAYCGDTDGPFDIDHIHPRSRGGSNEPDNLTVACFRCNRSKGALTVEEWRARQES